MAETIQDRPVAYLQDALAMERNVQGMLGSMRETTPDEKLRLRIERHEQETLRPDRSAGGLPLRPR